MCKPCDSVQALMGSIWTFLYSRGNMWYCTRSRTASGVNKPLMFFFLFIYVFPTLVCCSYPFSCLGDGLFFKGTERIKWQTLSPSKKSMTESTPPGLYETVLTVTSILPISLTDPEHSDSTVQGIATSHSLIGCQSCICLPIHPTKSAFT